MKRLIILFIALLFFVSIALACAWGWLNQQLHTASSTSEVQLVIEPGSSSRAIIETLAKAHVVDSPWPLMVHHRLNGGVLQAGEYRFEAGLTPLEALDKIKRGDVVDYKVTIPEGLTRYHIKELLVSAKIEGAEGWDVDSVKEGTLLPNTYHYQSKHKAADLVAMMQNAHLAALNDAWEQRQADLPVKNKEEAVILASIVEKETALPEERPMVAAVLVNRLRKGMKLQMDPTVIYAATNGTGLLDRPIYKSDLKKDSPYNTYMYAGLPPGPICNPGAESIRAALNPADSKVLYFVADGTGGHVFSTSYKEHQMHVQALRKRERQQKN